MQPDDKNKAGGVEPTQPVLGNNTEIKTFSQASLNSRKKRLATGLILLAVVVLGGTAGAYFGIISPNSPDNLWKSALHNSSEGYDKLVEHAQKQTNKGTNIKGNFKVDASDVVVDGNIEARTYEKNSTTKLDAGAAGARLNLELLTNSSDNSKYPDLYLKASGLKSLDSLLQASGQGIGDALSQYENQWYVLDHTLFDQIDKSGSNQKDKSSPLGITNLTKDDAVNIAEAVGKVNNDYLFTTNEDKAVLKINQKIGREKIDDRNVYHYKVGYDKNHLKDYVNSMKNELKNTKLKDYDLDKNFSDVEKSADRLNGNEQADAFVDQKTKTIRKIRFADANNKDAYTDLNFNYTGGDEYPFSVEQNGKEAKVERRNKFGVTLNTKQNQVFINFDINETEEGKATKFTLATTLSGNNDQIEFKKPDNAKPLMDVFNQLGGNQLLQGN